MFASNRILALDIGASKLLLAEFLVKGSEPVLRKYAMAPLAPDGGESGGDATASIAGALRGLMLESGFKKAPLLMALPGQKVFPRYVKLPPVGADKIDEMVSYEAEQNVPFPINEVVWDYQTVNSDDPSELNVLLVAVKQEDVREITDGVAAAGLEPDIVDAAPMALYNAVRFNYPDAQGCTMVLDLGARSTNLVFFEGGKIFTRSIPVAGNTITQEIAKGLNVKASEAEALKRQIGFVALGGVYAMTDDDRADRVSKVIRNVVTRLHAEVNRSINFYRSQQSGAAPERVLLTGGTSLIPYMDTFFREKLQIDVEYLNPFANIAIDPSLDSLRGENGDSQLMQLGGVVGLALRRCMSCPVEINLMPPALVASKLFRRRLPYFGLSAVGVILAMFCWSIYAKHLTGGYSEQREAVRSELNKLEALQGRITSLKSEQRTYVEKADLLGAMASNRSTYARLIESIRDVLLPSMWLTRFEPRSSGEDSDGAYDRVIIEGLAYEDALLEMLNRDGGNDKSAARAVDMLLARLGAGDNAPFDSDGSRVQQNLLVSSDNFRRFRLDMLLREPLGDPAKQALASAGEGL